CQWWAPRSGNRTATTGSGQPDRCQLRCHRPDWLTTLRTPGHPMPTYLLAIDQGTTSSRAMLFDEQCCPVSVDQQEFTQHFPRDGWVEHDPEEIWQSVLTVVRGALAKADLTAADVLAIGITNQRETTVVWDAATGE